MPKSFVGKFPIMNPIILARKACEGVDVLKKKKISDLCLFISIPEALVKSVRISIIFLTPLSDAYPYIITSSTNCWWVNGRSFPYSLRPLYFLLLTFTFIYLPRPSTARINKKGERGSPCLGPLVALNASVGDPLSIIERTGVVTIEIIQLIHLASKPNAFSVRCRYYQLSQS